jgi:predicted unusual protein kinase regulating ubiquinone biosynthesis (AarF/ABC1/UbiB family)
MAPESPLARRVKTLSALSGARLRRLLARARLAFTQDPGAATDRQIELAGARALLRSAGALKGGAAKVAQLLGYLEDPEAALGAEARAALASLFDHIPGSDPQGIRQVIEEELGRPPEALFAAWDDRPFAAASLGEVHAARTHAGQELAVKVQYPGVAAALAADLASPHVLRQLSGATGGALPAEALAALREAIGREADYRLEAQAMARFRRAFAADPQVVVPRVYPELSSGRVLSAERIFGAALLPFAQTAGAAARGRVGTLIFRVAFGAPLVHGLLNADPNPGNYLVLEEGARVAFLDFGCFAELPGDVVTCERVLFQSLLAGDAEVLRYALYREGLIREPAVFDADHYRGFERCLLLPFAAHRFRWTAAYARELCAHVSALLQDRRFTLPRGAVLLWRQRLGLAAVIGRLAAEGDFRAELLEMLRAVDMAPAGVR